MDRRTFLGAMGAATAGVALGPRWASADAPSAEVPQRYLYSYALRLDLERGFKFHCLIPRLEKDLYGAHEYAGFLTARVGDEPWMFIGDQPPQHTAAPSTLADLAAGTYRIRRQTPAWAIEQAADWRALYPAVWVSARVEAQKEAEATGGLMGWGWADRKAPAAWWADGKAFQRGEGATLSLPGGVRAVAYEDAHGPFTGLLVYTQPPERAWVDEDGVYWSWGRVTAGKPTELPVVAYALVPGRLAPDQAAALAGALAAPPGEVVAEVVAGERPRWRVRAAGARSVPVPPPLVSEARDLKGALALPTAAGDLLLLKGSEYQEELPVPAELERPLPAVDRAQVPALVRATVARYVTEILDHRRADGRFAFSEGRTFWDAFVVAALSQVLPLLDSPVREAARDGAAKCLDALWDQHTRSRAYGLTVPPEQPAFVESAVDYPEITSCLLYGTLAYALQVDREYPHRRAELIATHARQMAEMRSPCGLSYAAADADRLHVIAESAVGGYVGWASMYHLGRLLGRPDFAGESRARAALAWKSYRHLFRWRPEFGETGVVNGWWDWCAQVRVPESWAYVQTAWFSFIPLLPYEHEDRYGLWGSLRAQPWWQWTAGPPPTQRAYDFANALALARAGYVEEVKAHWRDIADRPFAWQSFDHTPVLAVAALPQLAALGALA